MYISNDDIGGIGGSDDDDALNSEARPTCAGDQQWRLLLGAEIACRDLHSREFHGSLNSRADIYLFDDDHHDCPPRDP